MDEPLSLGEASFGGVRLQQYEMSVDYLCPRSIVIFGGTNTGKTTFTHYLLNIMNRANIMDGALLFNPTGNDDYLPLFPAPFIHSKIEKPILEDLLKQQKHTSSLYKACNDPQTLQRAYDKYCTDSPYGRQIRAMELESATTIRSLRERSEDATRAAQLIKTVEATCQKMRVQMIKAALSAFWQRAKNANVVRDREDQMLLSNLETNPHFLIVFDDCASVLKSLWRSPIFEELYFNARHFFVSSIMLLQSAVIMDKKLRENAHIIFFTCSKSTLSFFANGGSKEEKRIAEAICASSFFDRKDEVYRVLFYSRGRFGFVLSQHARCGPFGSAIYQQLGQLLQQQQGTLLQRLAKEREEWEQ